MKRSLPLVTIVLRVSRERLRSLASPCSPVLCEDEGQDLIEYALVSLLLGLGCIALLKGCGAGVSSAFNSMLYSLSSSF